MQLPLYQVDAFASRVFAGNPAAVCPLEAWLDDAKLQAIAVENNLSETAFFVANGEDYDLRWFTPAYEVDLCGHATLASAYVIANHLQPGRERVVFHSRSGPLEVTRDGETYTLDFPARPAERLDEDPGVAAALGFAPQEVWQAVSTLAVLADEAEVRSVAPDLEKVAALPYDGLIVTARGDDCDFVSRYFAPHAGIPEDPVTGSTHTALAPFWAARLGKQRLSARQISARGGDLTVEDCGARVRITGRAALYMEGRIRV